MSKTSAEELGKKSVTSKRINTGKQMKKSVHDPDKECSNTETSQRKWTRKPVILMEKASKMKEIQQGKTN